VNVAAETVQLGDGHMALELPCSRQGRLELWSALQRVRALAGFNIHKLAGNFETLSPSELGQCVALRFNAQPRP
jgi:hypothetical protein